MLKQKVSSKNELLIICILTIALLALIVIALLSARKSEAAGFVKSMGAGWNLGNTLDSHKTEVQSGSFELYETYWGNPITTKAMIDEIKKAGFKTVRIPVTWYEHMDENGNIDIEWMKRVQEVVDYVISNEMYVIINAHHDTWYTPSYANEEGAKRTLSIVWGQIADYFKEYGEQLVFEAMNEPRLIDTELEWKAGNEEAWAVLNKLNRIFVETVRASGGKNKKRYLMLPTYGASGEREALEAMELPKDNHLIVSVHAYMPYEFAMKEDGTARWNIENPQDTERIQMMFDDLFEVFVEKGIPVIIGEFAAADKNNIKDRVAWSQYFVKEAKERQIMYIWWDEGKTDRYALFDRYSLTFRHPEIMEVLTK